MVFTVKVAFNMEIVKIEKLTEVYGGNPRTEHFQIWSTKMLTINLLKFTLRDISMIFTVKVVWGFKNNKTSELPIL